MNSLSKINLQTFFNLSPHPLNCTEDSFVDPRKSSKLIIAYSYSTDRTKINNFPMFLGFLHIFSSSFTKIESLVEEL